MKKYNQLTDFEKFLLGITIGIAGDRLIDHHAKKRLGMPLWLAATYTTAATASLYLGGAALSHELGGGRVGVDRYRLYIDDVATIATSVDPTKRQVAQQNMVTRLIITAQGSREGMVGGRAPVPGPVSVRSYGGRTRI